MMTWRYLILIGDHGPQSGTDRPVPSSAGLQEIDFNTLLPKPARVFISSNTPVISIPGIGVLIGHVFLQDGTPINDTQSLARVVGNTDLSQSILRHCWGEYLLVQAPSDHSGSLRILRDPTGGIPCLYNISNGVGFATSSITLAEALGLYSRQIDWNAIVHRLSYPYRRTERTTLASIRELLPGCAMTAHRSSVSVNVAWSPWDHLTEERCRDPHEAAVGIRHAVSAAVTAWARTDQSVLLELSGGLDSSIVGACLRESNARVTCCTIMAPVRGTDERSYARKIASYLGVDLHTVEISFEDALYDFPISRDAPVPGMGVLHYAVDQAMSKAGVLHGANSYFSGGGGDSIFCYLKTASPAADAFLERGIVSGFGAVRDLASLHDCTLWKAGRLTLRKLRRGAKASYKADTTFLHADAFTNEPENHPWLDSPSDALPGDCEKIFGLTGTQSYRDGMMRTEHRPMRFPLLSQPVMQACLKVPTWMWIAGGMNRAVARAAFADRLPVDILYRRSKGTYITYCGAIYSRTKEGMLDFLANGHLSMRGLLDLPALELFARSELSPEDQSFMRIMDLCMIENWVRQQV